MPSLFVDLFLIPFFFKLIGVCIFCVFYVGEDDDSNVWGVIRWLIWTSLSVVPKKTDKTNHSLTHWL